MKPRTALHISRRLALLLCALVAACAPGRELARSGQQLIQEGRLQEGLAQLERAVAAEPDNREYRMQLVRQRELLLSQLLTQADTARQTERLDEAAVLWARAQAIDPNNTRARDGLADIQAARLKAERAKQATAGRPEELAAEQPPMLRAALRKPMTLDFRDASLKAVFDALSRGTGINFVFDREVKTDTKVTINVNNVSIDDLIGVIALTNGLERKTLNDNTVLVYPNTPAKQKDYLDLAVRTFYLANADAKAVFALLKTVLKTKDLHADERLNSLTMRDTPEALRLAERLIAAQDLPEPEVVLDVEVLEVKRTRLTEIGIEPPGKFSVLNLVQNPATVVSTATGATTVVNNTTTTTQLTLDKLRGIRSSSVGIDNPALNLRSEIGDTNILANPRIRAKNHEKARILIGDRVPVITSTAAANVGVSESVTYLDVGLKLDVEPNVFLDNEVGVKVNLEVSNVVREIRSRSGTLTYQIGTRLATTQLRLRDGETQALAGLISDEDRRGVVGAPGATDLPILGRLFSSERNDHAKTEIVLLVTPRVVRNLSSSVVARGGYSSGTEAAVGAAPTQLRTSGRLAQPPTAAPVPAETVQGKQP